MEQIGYVSGLDGEYAFVDVRRVSACGDKCGSCGGGCSVPSMRIRIKNTLEAKVGDSVEVKMETKTVLNSALIAYVIPLIAMILGIIIGVHMFKIIGSNNYELYGFAIGLVFLGLSYVLLRVIDSKTKDSNKINFQMIKKVN